MTDPFSQHEALDRAHLIADAFERQIADHPFIRAHPDLDAKSAAIAEALDALYQAIGTTEAAGVGITRENCDSAGVRLRK
jgi:hypothetical protein